MEITEVLGSPGKILALAESVCASLNGPASYRLASWLELVAAGLAPEPGDGSQEIGAALSTLDADRPLHWDRVLAGADFRLVTVLDDEYPANLRMVHDRPPFLFVRGSLEPDDARAVAVVGTRNPSSEGRDAAHHLAAQLAERRVTVVSGLAAGIDTAAHTGAISAGGRTLAVFGTGIERVYPAANAALARRIPDSGAVLSQFWPQTAPARWTFPVRNIVTSGLALGTVVVEAGSTSGARQQAEHALRHGKRLFLLSRLVEGQEWARALVGHPGVSAIESVDEVVEAVELELDLEPEASM